VVRGVKHGADPAQVAAELSALLKQPAGRIAALLARPGVVIRRGIDLQAAARFQAALEQAGCNSVVEPETVSAAIHQQALPADLDRRMPSIGAETAAHTEITPGRGTEKGKANRFNLSTALLGGGLLLLMLGGATAFLLSGETSGLPGDWSCSSLNPNGQTTSVAYAFRSDGTFRSIEPVEKTSPIAQKLNEIVMLGSYSVKDPGRTIELHITELPGLAAFGKPTSADKYVRGTVGELSGTSLKMSLTTETSGRPREIACSRSRSWLASIRDLLSRSTASLRSKDVGGTNAGSQASVAAKPPDPVASGTPRKKGTPPSFLDYRTEAFGGPYRLPEDKSVREVVDHGPDVAGRYFLITSSCGTACEHQSLIDLRTGLTVDTTELVKLVTQGIDERSAPEGQPWSMVGIPNSKLVAWTATLDRTQTNCRRLYTVLEDAKFQVVGAPLPISCYENEIVLEAQEAQQQIVEAGFGFDAINDHGTVQGNIKGRVYEKEGKTRVRLSSVKLLNATDTPFELENLVVWVGRFKKLGSWKWEGVAGSVSQTIPIQRTLKPREEVEIRVTDELIIGVGGLTAMDFLYFKLKADAGGYWPFASNRFGTAVDYANYDTATTEHNGKLSRNFVAPPQNTSSASGSSRSERPAHCVAADRARISGCYQKRSRAMVEACINAVRSVYGSDCD